MKNKIYYRAALICFLFAAALILASLLVPADEAEAAVVKQGATGSLVRTIQTKLKNWGYYTGSVDGIFGSKTTAAVKYFQRRNGLVVDGIVGNATAAAMGISLSSASSGGSGSRRTGGVRLSGRVPG